MSKRILVVEDDADIRDIVQAFLEDAGYQVLCAADGLEGIERFRAGGFDLVLLDVMMPKINGYVVCEMIRAESQVPVIMLTALDDEPDELRGFEVQADDYVTKPFSVALLQKRVEAVLRRAAHSGGGELLCLGGLCVDAGAYRATVDGAPVELTTREFEVLVELLRHRGRVLTRENLLSSLWKYDFLGDERIVDTHIKNLRRKLGMDCIKTIRGVGYRIDDE